jgi:hypothetical protein
MSNLIEQFRNAIVESGFQCPEQLTADGVIHHFATGRSDTPTHFYLLKTNGYGVFCNIRNGVRFELKGGGNG